MSYDIGYDPEVPAGFQDADLEMAEMTRLGRSVDAARQAGRCCHLSTVSYVGKVFYPEQVGLKPGQSRCTEGCGRVFNSDEEWHLAMDEAIN